MFPVLIRIFCIFDFFPLQILEPLAQCAFLWIIPGILLEFTALYMPRAPRPATGSVAGGKEEFPVYPYR